MSTQFAGLSNQFFRFLTDLQKNNNREWFTENKERYQKQIVTPMLEFMRLIQPKIAKISPHIIVKVKAHNGSLFRIYRDTRFSNDKTPYKTHVACHFRHELGRNAHAPGLYVHFAPDEIRFGGGIWKPDSLALGKLRDSIVDNANAWKSVKNRKAFKELTTGIQGDSLIRTPRGYSTDHQHIEDLKRKSFFAMHQSTMKVAKSADLLSEVEKSFKAISPLLDFIAFSLDLRY
ncbi:hypothetical protein MNBD_GAMMA12-2732 [hydrothermal vent metagenome]|uniref:TIGR02453 family protein n=1 Tax=hydrothermal vent metagenome TaxID=652676 RepID=A0A3B0Y2V6_9ZZZZ